MPGSMHEWIADFDSDSSYCAEEEYESSSEPSNLATSSSSEESDCDSDDPPISRFGTPMRFLNPSLPSWKEAHLLSFDLVEAQNGFSFLDYTTLDRIELSRKSGVDFSVRDSLGRSPLDILVWYLLCQQDWEGRFVFAECEDMIKLIDVVSKVAGQVFLGGAFFGSDFGEFVDLKAKVFEERDLRVFPDHTMYTLRIGDVEMMMLRELLQGFRAVPPIEVIKQVFHDCLEILLRLSVDVMEHARRWPRLSVNVVLDSWPVVWQLLEGRKLQLRSK